MALFVTLEDGLFDLPGAGAEEPGLVELHREPPPFDGDFLLTRADGSVRIDRVLVALPGGRSFLTERVF